MYQNASLCARRGITIMSWRAARLFRRGEVESTDAVSVLVVEDSIDLADALAIELTGNGYSVRTARDGEQALAMIGEARPHCVILDVLMPGMGGHQLAARLRELFSDDIVLIAISGHERAAAEVRQAFETVDHYLQKPFEFSELSKILRPLR